MNEKIIKEIVDDYSIRELQIYSSIILSNIDATNNIIKQFKADHDSHQFYKNVIIWYVKKHNIFPEIYTTFDFPLNDGGLGDRFVLASTLLFTIDSFRGVLNPQINLHVKLRHDHELALSANDFYDVIDFFHFKRPKQKILTRKVQSSKSFEDCIRSNEYNEIFRDHHDEKYWKHGVYWPINFDPNSKTIITFMLYTYEGADDKTITKNMLNEFVKIKNKFLNLNFVRLNDINFAENVELLSKSHLLIASEGMWTHLSRAMNIPTIAFTKNEDFIREINQQGHFCSGNFEECLNKLIEKCTNLTK